MKKNSLLFLFLLLQLFAYGRKDNSPALQAQQLSFQENKGQIRDRKGNPRTDIDFILQAPGMTLYIGQGQLHYQFIKEQPRDTASYTRDNPPKHYQVASGFTISRLDLSLEGASKDAIALKEDPRKSKYHYYTGSNSDGVTGVQAYGKIVYKNIYPSIDWVLYTNGKGLKYDFIVHPGGKVSDIRMKYEGAQSIRLQNDGSLKVGCQLGSLTEEAPYSYELEGKQAVNSSFILDQNILSYRVAPHNGTLVIDPGVEWATYFGGDGSDHTQSNFTNNNMAYDPDGYIYISGLTTSLFNLATTGAHQDTFGGGFQDGFLAKFDTLGQLQWTSYYGGDGLLDNTSTALSGSEVVATVGCDAFGNVYLAGTTFSATGMATPGSYQDTGSSEASERNYAGGANGYLVKFNESGIRQWGTYYGASTSMTAFLAVSCDPGGNVYVGGYADSSSSTTGALVTPGAHQAVYDAPPPFVIPFPGFPAQPYFNGLLVKFDSSGNRQWATYFGDDALSGSSRITDIACDVMGDVYITGAGTGGSVTQGTHEDVLNPNVNGFLSKFDATGEQIWGSYLNSNTNVLFIDSFQHLYVAGSVSNTGSDSFIVTPGCYQPNTISSSTTGTSNGFLIQMNPDNGTRNWGTYYGAEGTTYVYDVTADYQGKVYIAGSTNSYGDPFTYTIATPGAYKDTLTTGTSSYDNDAFVAQFDSIGSRKWASYYGGAGDDQGTALICDQTGALYMSGTTRSDLGIAISGAHQDTLNGAADVFLMRWLPVDMALTDVVSPDRDTVCSGELPFSVSVKNQGRMDLLDTLKISYSFTGPATGNADFLFTDDLAVGQEVTFDLGVLDMLFPGDYEVTVYLHISRGDQERDNDTLRFTLTATNAEPVADIEVNQVGTVFHFSNPSAQPSDSYFWSFGDGETSTEPNPSHEYAVTDTYQVTLIITGFCGSDTATASVFGIGGNGIDELLLSGTLSVYPNPAKQVLYITADNKLQLESYSIVNVLGQEVQGGSLKMQSSVNVSGLASGSYVIRIRTDKGMVSKQFQLLGR